MQPAIVPNQKVYLVKANKFWEIQNFEVKNHIRYGKLIDNLEREVRAGFFDYQSTEKALKRASLLIQDKQQKGYSEACLSPEKPTNPFSRKTNSLKPPCKPSMISNRFASSVLQQPHPSKTRKLAQDTLIRLPQTKPEVPSSASVLQKAMDCPPEQRLEVVLQSLGLQSYLRAFQSEGVSFEEFLKLSKRDMENLGLAPSVRRKISEFINC